MIFLYDFKSDNANITADTAIPGFGVDNMADTRLSRTYRAISTTANIVVDFGSAVKFDCFAMAHNLSDTATVTLQWNSSNSWGTPAGSTSVTVSGDKFVHTFTEVEYRYARIVISDSTNAFGQIEIGRLGIGSRFNAPQVATDLQLPRFSTTDRSFSRSRQAYFNEGVRFRGIELQFNYVTEAEYNSFNAMFEVSDIKPIFVLFDELTNEAPLYAVISDEFDHSYLGGFGFYTINMDIQEVF